LAMDHLPVSWKNQINGIDGFGGFCLVECTEPKF
jgi:hypothetical protein